MDKEKKIQIEVVSVGRREGEGFYSCCPWAFMYARN
jgi:hypothetical protein